MSKANTTPTTNPRPRALLGEITIPNSIFLPGVDTTGTYAMRLVGRCLEPVAMDGEHAIICPLAPYEPGDFVAIMFADDDLGPIIKRLVMPSLLPIGTPANPNATLHSHIMVEMLYPRRVLQFRVDKLKAVHRVIGFLKRDGSMAELPAADRARRFA